MVLPAEGRPAEEDNGSKKMIGLNPDCPPSVTLLADHLDSALAAGEDLMASTLAARSDLDEADTEAAPEALDDFVRHLMKLESALLLRVLQARRLSADLGQVDGTLKAAGLLFKAQTDALEDLIFRAGRTAAAKLTRPGDGHAYLRARGLIAPEAAAPSPFECVAVSEAFRVGGVAPLGLLLDMVSSLLDLLDARFGLYAPDATEELAALEVDNPAEVHADVSTAAADGDGQATHPASRADAAREVEAAAGDALPEAAAAVERPEAERPGTVSTAAEVPAGGASAGL